MASSMFLSMSCERITLVRTSSNRKIAPTQKSPTLVPEPTHFVHSENPGNAPIQTSTSPRSSHTTAKFTVIFLCEFIQKLTTISTSPIRTNPILINVLIILKPPHLHLPADHKPAPAAVYPFQASI